MAACSSCTFLNAADANACDVCGTSLGSAPPTTDAAVKTCAHCTLENAADASACVACGAWWCPRCTRCVPAAIACCDVCGYPDDVAAEGANDDTAAVAPIAPDDVAKDYRPRRVERALAAMPTDALERIVDEPARFVALACGEVPPAPRPVGRIAEPEPAPGAVADVSDGGDGSDSEDSDDADDYAAAEEMLGDASSCPVCGASAATRELLVAHCIATHVWDQEEVRRRRAARPPRKKKRRRRPPAETSRDDDEDHDDLDDFIVADDEELEEYDSGEEDV